MQSRCKFHLHVTTCWVSSLSLSLLTHPHNQTYTEFFFLHLFSSFCFTLLHTHTKCRYTHMHISLCSDTSEPLYPPFRLGATRLIHLHGSRGERGATRGTNMTRKRREKRVEEESRGVSCNLTETLLYLLHLGQWQLASAGTLWCHLSHHKCASYNKIIEV